MTLDEVIGGEVRATRARLGWRQVDLAERVNELVSSPDNRLTQPRLSKIESGKTSATVAELVRIAVAAGVPITALVPAGQVA